jgi:hypothetical protein
MGVRWAGFSRAACTSGVGDPRPRLLLIQGLIGCCECEGMKRRRRRDEMSEIGQCAETVGLLVFEPAARAILTVPTLILLPQLAKAIHLVQ